MVTNTLLKKLHSHNFRIEETEDADQTNQSGVKANVKKAEDPKKRFKHQGNQTPKKQNRQRQEKRSKRNEMKISVK